MWNFKKYYNRIALVDNKDQSYTYEMLDESQKEFAMNINGRALVFIVCTNTIESIIAYVSCVCNHIPVMLIDEHIMQERLNELINKFEPKYVFVPNTYISTNKDIFDEKKTIKEYDYYTLFGLEWNNQYAIHEDLALLLSTSGSTGASKHVRISYINLQVNTKGIVDALNITSKDRAITSLPMNYCYGLSIINTHLYAGATVLVSDEKIISKKYWQFAMENGMTTFAGVPYTYEVLRKLKIFDKNIPSLRKLQQAGGKLNEDMEKYLRNYSINYGVELYLMYGQTEATARMSCIKAEDDSVFGSVGKALTECKVKVLLDNGCEATPFEKGDIVFYGANVSLGYAEDKEMLCLGDENKGVLETKDIGYVDNAGNLYVLGRKDRVVKLKGLRMDIDAIEEYLKKKFSGKYEVRCENEEIIITGDNIHGDEKEYVAQLLGVNERIVKVM